MRELASDNVSVRIGAFAAVRWLRGYDMIRAVAEHLPDEAESGSVKRRSRDDVVWPSRYLAVRALRGMVQDAGALQRNRNCFHECEVEMWRVWWQENSHRYR